MSCKKQMINTIIVEQKEKLLNIILKTGCSLKENTRNTYRNVKKWV